MPAYMPMQNGKIELLGPHQVSRKRDIGNWGLPREEDLIFPRNKTLKWLFACFISMGKWNNIYLLQSSKMYVTPVTKSLMACLLMTS